MILCFFSIPIDLQFTLITINLSSESVWWLTLHLELSLDDSHALCSSSEKTGIHCFNSSALVLNWLQSEHIYICYICLQLCSFVRSLVLTAFLMSLAKYTCIFIRYGDQPFLELRHISYTLCIRYMIFVFCNCVYKDLSNILFYWNFTVTLEDNEKFTNHTMMFLLKMRQQNPAVLSNKEYEQVFDMILTADIRWSLQSESELKENYQLNEEATILDLVSSRNPRSAEVNNKSNINSSHIGIPEKVYSIEEKIAHALHLGSISLLGIILLEVYIVSF